MPPIKSLEDLQKLANETQEKQKRAAKNQVNIAMGSCSIAAGAQATLESILDFINVKHLTDVTITQTGCMGLCGVEPTIQVLIGEKPEVTYGKVTPEIARRILQDHVIGGQIVTEYVVLQ